MQNPRCALNVQLLDINALGDATAGGGNKFVVRRHPATGMYVTLSNPQTPDSQHQDQRNVLALTISVDLLSWRRRARNPIALVYF